MEFLSCILIFLVSVNPKSPDHWYSVNAKSSHLCSNRNREYKDTIQPEEFFADSLHIGRKRLNKVELTKYGSEDTGYVIIRFFSKQQGKWVPRNKYQFEKKDAMGCNTQLSDFNKDGCNDMTYVSREAARGANEVRRLFVYDKSKDRLVYIKNSEDYPNLRYNKELNCIDAFLVYGGSMTVFLRLKGDRLEMFASVEANEGLTIREYDKNGKEKIIQRDPNYEALYVRFKNYRPLKESEAY